MVKVAHSTVAAAVVEGDGVGLGVDTGDDRHGGEEEGCKETSREHDDDGECERGNTSDQVLKSL